MTLQEALDALAAFGNPYLTAIKGERPAEWGLKGVRALLSDLGDPHLAYPTFHVAGTKGKGSTAAFIAQGLTESGLRTGLYTSPHLENWRERVQVDRAWIAEDQLIAIVQDILPYAQAYPDLTSFEVTTALALWHFAREGCEAAVIEVGLGGSLDATSVVEPVVSVLTSISLDHTQILGNSVAQIARDKAAIIKPGTLAVSAPQVDPALNAIEERAAAVASPLTVVGRDSTFDLLYATWSGSGLRHTDGGTVAMYRITMPGLFQVENAGVAVSALRRAQEAGLPITEQGIAEGLQHALWPGRMEMVSHHPRIVIDGAHNPYSIGKLVESLTHLEEGQRFVFVFGCMADKDIKGIVSHLVPVAEQIILTRADSDRAAPTGLLEETIHNVADPTAPPLAHTQSVQEALELVEASMPDTLTCVTGSLAVVGEARTAILGTAIQ